MKRLGADVPEMVIILMFILLAGWAASFLWPTRHLKSATPGAALFSLIGSLLGGAICFYYCWYTLHAGYIRCISQGRRGRQIHCGWNFTDDNGVFHPAGNHLARMTVDGASFWPSYVLLATLTILLIASAFISYRQYQYLKQR